MLLPDSPVVRGPKIGLRSKWCISEVLMHIADIVAPDLDQENGAPMSLHDHSPGGRFMHIQSL